MMTQRAANNLWAELCNAKPAMSSMFAMLNMKNIHISHSLQQG